MVQLVTKILFQQLDSYRDDRETDLHWSNKQSHLIVVVHSTGQTFAEHKTKIKAESC